MLEHHRRSIDKLIEYFKDTDGLIAIILGGSVMKGNARPDSDIDAMIVVTEEKYAEQRAKNRLAEVITGHCTYPGGYFDIKYKTKDILQQCAERASEPTRNAYVHAKVALTRDPEITELVNRIAAYPERERADKIRCFNADLALNRGYFLQCVPQENTYMRAHLAQEIVYSVYRLILAENRVLFPCNRRLEEAVTACKHRPENILVLGAAFLQNICTKTCDAFVDTFLAQTDLPLTFDVSENCSQYVRFYEDWWKEKNAPFPNEW